MVLAHSLLGSKEVLGLVGEQGSEQGCSQPPYPPCPRLESCKQNLFPSTPIVGPCTKAPRGQAPVGSVTHVEMKKRVPLGSAQQNIKVLIFNMLLFHSKPSVQLQVHGTLLYMCSLLTALRTTFPKVSIHFL